MMKIPRCISTRIFAD